jgi:uncharacterized protein with von Willebrand factor type A (vWA) domain
MEPNKSSVSNEELAKHDFVVMIDKSGSMSSTDCPGGKSRWKYAQEQTEAIARQCAEFDADGIDVVVFAGQPKEYKGVTPEKVTQIFTENSPSGGTDTAAALKLVFDGYNARKAAGNAKPLIVICVTDGEPTDQKAVDKVLIDHANSLSDDGETGVTFVQIGKDAGARAFLQHLDDDLQGLGAKYDIVDTKNEQEMDNMSITDLLVAAITD